METQLKVMIVEDDRDSLLGINILLRKSGYSVSSAADASQAMAVARKSTPDIIVLDLGLPAGGGQFVLERLRSDLDFVFTPVIILSAFPANEQTELVIQFNVFKYLEKPASNQELLQAIKQGLECRSAALDNREVKISIG